MTSPHSICRCTHGAEDHYNDGRGSSCRICECERFAIKGATNGRRPQSKKAGRR